MKRTQSFAPGIATLLGRHRDWIEGQRVGLVSHQAAVDTDGATTAERLWTSHGIRLAALMGPEHGFFGLATAGEPLANQKYTSWHIPVFSLYGETRKPTPEMFSGVDVVVFDLQDLGFRPYTYVSTLRHVLEAASECGKRVVVADRPVPLPCVTDGPLLSPGFESFVACVPAPMSYGMTPGETALWLKADLRLPLRLDVAPMRHYHREPRRASDWPPWIPPSPGIRSWESAQCYLATVFTEALPAVDCGRTTTLPFQLIGATWVKGEALCEGLTALALPGVAFHLHEYSPAAGPFANERLHGMRMTVRDPAAFRPVLTAVSIIATLQNLYGRKRLWGFPGTRPEFFDKLFGTDAVRLGLMDGESGTAAAARWKADLNKFRRRRREFLLYPER